MTRILVDGLSGTYRTLDERAAEPAPPRGKRVSVNEGDPGFALFQAAMAAGQRVRVLVDGQEVKHAVTADEAEGFADFFVMGLGGDALTDGNGIRKVHRRTGRVQIVVE